MEGQESLATPSDFPWRITGDFFDSYPFYIGVARIVENEIIPKLSPRVWSEPRVDLPIPAEKNCQELMSTQLIDTQYRTLYPRGRVPRYYLQ